MLRIRKSPFGRDEDAAEFMIQLVDQQAGQEGTQLTLAERALLRNEIGPDEVPREFHDRMVSLVDKVLKKEIETGKTDPSRSFNGAVEWAGDQEYPYVVWLAENAIGRALGKLSGRAAAKDALLCIGCALLIVTGMFLIVVVLGLMGLLD